MIWYECSACQESTPTVSKEDNKWQKFIIASILSRISTPMCKDDFPLTFIAFDYYNILSVLLPKMRNPSHWLTMYYRGAMCTLMKMGYKLRWFSDIYWSLRNETIHWYFHNTSCRHTEAVCMSVCVCISESVRESVCVCVWMYILNIP
jgi:hypothetical protein